MRRSASREEPLARGAELERERGVDDVAAREAEVQVPALGPDRLGDLGDERDHVVVGRPLDLGDPLDVDPSPAPRSPRARRPARGRAPTWARQTASSTSSIRSKRAWSRPDGAHLRQRVARDHRAGPRARAATSAAMSWRRCMPSQRIASAARSAASRAAPRSRAPPDDRQHPAAVRPEAALRAGRRCRRGRRARPAPPPRRGRRSGRPAAGRRDSPWRRARCRRPRPGAPAGRRDGRRERAARGREQERAERAGQARQDDLRLGVAEPRVALEEDRAVRGQHQAGVEEAAERGAAARPSRRGSGDGRRPRPAPRPPSSRSGSGEYAPMPPVFGPRSPSHRRLWSRAAGRAAARVPSQTAMTLASRPSRRSSMTRAGASGRAPGEERRREVERLLGRVGDDHALARGEAVGLEDGEPAVGVELADERQGRVGLAARERARPRHPDAGRRGDLVAERLRRLERGRGPVGPEDRDPRGAQRVGDPDRERRLRPDDDELRRHGARERDDRGRVERVDGHGADACLAGDAGAARGDDDLVDAGLGRELPREGVLAPAATDDEDAGRHDERHRPPPPVPGIDARWRIGRQARSIVWVRSGPTDTNTIGTPACSSSADTYRRAVSGRSASAADVVDRLLPALEVLVHGHRPRERGAARRPAVDAPPVDVVARRTAGSSRARTGCRAC